MYIFFHNSPIEFVVLLHGYDDDYDHDDILTHTSKVGILGKNTLKWLLDDNTDETDENGDAWTKETIFRSYIPKNFIHTRKILLGSLQDGLTFGGKPDPSAGLEMGCGLSSIFAMVPIEAIEQIYFARPKITVEDLWAVLKPKFGEGGEELSYTILLSFCCTCKVLTEAFRAQNPIQILDWTKKARKLR